MCRARWLTQMLCVRSKTRRRARGRIERASAFSCVCVFSKARKQPRRRVPLRRAIEAVRSPAVQAATQYTERCVERPGEPAGARSWVNEALRKSAKILDSIHSGSRHQRNRRTRMDHRDYLSDQQHRHFGERSAKSLSHLSNGLVRSSRR